MTDTIRKSPALASVYTTTLILSPLKALPFRVRLFALGWAGPRPWSTKIGCSYRWVLCTRRRDARSCPPGALGPGESLYYRTTAQNSRITDACARGGEAIVGYSVFVGTVQATLAEGVFCSSSKAALGIPPPGGQSQAHD